MATLCNIMQHYATLCNMHTGTVQNQPWTHS